MVKPFEALMVDLTAVMSYGGLELAVKDRFLTLTVLQTHSKTLFVIKLKIILYHLKVSPALF